MRAVRRGALAAMGAGLALASISGCSRSAPTSTSQAASPTFESNRGGTGAAEAQAGSPASPDESTGSSGNSPPSQNVESLAKSPTEAGRQIVSTAMMIVQVDDVVAAKQKAEALVTGLEPANVLFAEQTSLPGQPTASSEKARSTITFKVAPSKFTEVLADLAGLGKLSSQEVKTDDVTQQVIDLDAHIAAAEQSTARVADLVAKTTSLTELAQLENEVTRRQADLESLRGQKRTLAARTELATVVVTLTAAVVPVAATETEPKPLPGFLDGLRGGWDAFLDVVTVVGAVAGALVPFAWIPLLAFVAWRLTRRRREVPPAPAPAP